MGKTKNLLKNTGILMIGKLSSQLVNFLLLPLYTAKLATSEYGQIDIYISLLMIITPFITLQLEQGLFRYMLSAKNEEEKKEIISSSGIVLLGSIGAYIVLFIFTNAVFKLDYALILFFYYLSYAFFNVMLQVCRVMISNIVYSVATFLSTVTIIILSIIFVLCLDIKIEGVLLANIIGYMGISICLLFKSGFIKYCDFRKKYLCKVSELLKYSIPLIFNQIASWVINYSDRLIILMFLGVSSNGIYSVSNKFFSVLVSFFGVYNLAWTESVSKDVDGESDDAYISGVVQCTFELYGLLTIWVIVALSFVFNLLVNQSYVDAYNYIPMLVFAAFFSGASATIGSIYIANKKTVNVAVTTVMAGVINIVVHLILVKYIGLYAAAVSTLISFAALFLYRILGIRSIQKLSIVNKFSWLIIALGILEWGVYVYRDYRISIIGLAVLIIFSLYFIKNRGKEVIKVLKK